MKLLTHFIAGYPDPEGSFETAAGLLEGGAWALEMQIPFSDPSADGPVIENACRKALEAGFRVSDGFALLGRIREISEAPVFIMSYSSIVFNTGIENFVRRAKDAGASGLIIPDLTPGDDEGLYTAGRTAGIDVIPVIVPGVSEQRLERIMSEQPAWVYLALRSGITGSYTELDETNLGFLGRLKKYRVNVMAGFGIRTSQQVRMLEPHCEAAIAGSFIVNRIDRAVASGQPVREAAAEAAAFLLE